MIHANRLIIIGAIVGLILFVGTNMAIAGFRALAVPGYWQARMREPVAPNAIRLVALGDSSVEAIGASHPMDGYWTATSAGSQRTFTKRLVDRDRECQHRRVGPRHREQSAAQGGRNEGRPRDRGG